MIKPKKEINDIIRGIFCTINEGEFIYNDDKAEMIGKIECIIIHKEEVVYKMLPILIGVDVYIKESDII